MEYTEEDYERRNFGFNRQEGEVDDPFSSWMRDSKMEDEEGADEEGAEEEEEEETQVRP